MARGSWAGSWPGGRIWRAADGSITYVIRRKVAGRPYHVSTRCASLGPAMKQWERFQADPEGYSPSGQKGEPLVLDAELAAAFLRWSRDGKGNSVQWVAKQKRYLAWWAGVIGRRDLRRVSLRDQLRPALDRVTNAKQRIETIKALYGWLRKERHTITAAEDPTYGTLSVPQGRPEQWVTPKIIPRASHDAAWNATTQPWRDMLTVLAGTGWHVTELERFIRSGIVADLPTSASHGHGAFKVLVCPRRKSGEMQRTAVTVEAAEAAIRLRERGTYSQVRFYRAVAAACRAADVPPFSPGRYRHTVATWAIEAGADPAAVAAFLGHKSPATTRRFYATLAVAPEDPDAGLEPPHVQAPNLLGRILRLALDEALEVLGTEADRAPQPDAADAMLDGVHVVTGDLEGLRDFRNRQERRQGGGHRVPYRPSTGPRRGITERSICHSFMYGMDQVRRPWGFCVGPTRCQFSAPSSAVKCHASPSHIFCARSSALTASSVHGTASRSRSLPSVPCTARQ